jgi:hypothetical protein
MLYYLAGKQAVLAALPTYGMPSRTVLELLKEATAAHLQPPLSTATNVCSMWISRHAHTPPAERPIGGTLQQKCICALQQQQQQPASSKQQQQADTGASPWHLFMS